MIFVFVRYGDDYARFKLQQSSPSKNDKIIDNDFTTYQNSFETRIVTMYLTMTCRIVGILPVIQINKWMNFWYGYTVYNCRSAGDSFRQYTC